MTFEPMPFALVTLVRDSSGEATTFARWQGLGRRSPLVAGLFAFFLESSFLSLLIWGEKRLGPKWHFRAALALWAGSWLSGYFITATNAFMQHPVGYTVGSNGALQLASFSAFAACIDFRASSIQSARAWSWLGVCLIPLTSDFALFNT